MPHTETDYRKEITFVQFWRRPVSFFYFFDFFWRTSLFFLFLEKRGQKWTHRARPFFFGIFGGSDRIRFFFCFHLYTNANQLWKRAAREGLALCVSASSSSSGAVWRRMVAQRGRKEGRKGGERDNSEDEMRSGGRGLQLISPYLPCVPSSTASSCFFMLLGSSSWFFFHSHVSRF